MNKQLMGKIFAWGHQHSEDAIFTYYKFHPKRKVHKNIAFIVYQGRFIFVWHRKNSQCIVSNEIIE